MDGALGRDADIAVQSANQELANLASTPMGFLALQGDNQALDLGWQLVGIAHGAARAIRQRFDPAMLVALEDLVAGLAGDPELPADLRHRFAIEQFRHKPQALVHHRTLLPRHRHLPLEGGKCYLCVRYALLPMSRAAQNKLVYKSRPQRPRVSAVSRTRLGAGPKADIADRSLRTGRGHQ